MIQKIFQQQTFRLLLFVLTLSCFACSIKAQKNNLTPAYKAEVIQKLSKELQDRYVFPEIAAKTVEHIEGLQKEGHFESIHKLDEFSKELSTSIYEITNDKHITVNLKQRTESADDNDSNTNWMTNRLEERTFYRRYNANFKSVTKLDGNIGYLELRGFYGMDMGKKFADHAMAMLSTSDAIIIDLRNNSGGRGDMVNYLLSYFFEEPIVTGKSRKRSGDTFNDRTHMTSRNTSTKKLPDTPLFVLTSAKTFSAAEAFSFPLQVYKRATFIGETTKGGGNAGDIISINADLEVFIPDVGALPHPISNSTFEGIGIIPDIDVKSEDALDRAIEEAKIASVEYKSVMDAKALAALKSLDQTLSNYKGVNKQLIVDAYLNCKAHDIIFEEWELNSYGYQLVSTNKKETALAIFKTNTVLYPNSPNTYDSYAESLIENGNIKEGLTNYEKAVSVAELNGDRNLDFYKEKLRKAQMKGASANGK